jgi:hypothetical protein
MALIMQRPSFPDFYGFMLHQLFKHSRIGESPMEEGIASRCERAHYIFPTSATMIGVCLTIITLFKVMKLGMTTIADEILSIDTMVYILSCLFSYLALTRSGQHMKRFELVADISFFIGTLMLALIGVIIVFIGI